jgi:hypothetical protein
MEYSLSPTDLDRLTKLLGMFSSSFDGEVVNAARSAQQLVAERQTTWRDVLVRDDPAMELGRQDARPMPWAAMLKLFPDNWAEVVRMCARVADSTAINDRDRQFIRSVAGYQTRPSPKQILWLRSVVERLAAQQEGSS